VHERQEARRVLHRPRGLRGGVKRCLGGSDHGSGCKDDSDCADPGVCNAFNGTCAGGANNGYGCDAAGDCPGGTCNLAGGGGVCGSYIGICEGGSEEGEACNSDADCAGGGQCQAGHGRCSGGKKNDKKCRHHKHCKGGGTCSGEDAGAPGLIDPCDPYCNVRTDTPTGLDAGSPFGLLDGGLYVASTADAAAAPSSLQTTATGDSLCAGAVNVHSNPCNGPPASVPLTSCQQDFHCDTASNTCKWNGGEGWFDGTAGGIDLTIGAGCTYSGSELIPICNRGSAPVPPNTILGVNITNAVEDGCTAVHATADCSVNVGALGLNPGKCTNVVGCPVSGNKNAVVNASGRDIAEAPGRCANNASAVKPTGGTGCSACTTCVTTLTGRIYDPRGVNPLPNVMVYVPSTTPSPMPTTLACDTCTSLATGNPMTLTTTNFDGTFTLNNVPVGIPFPVVILTGRWRRQVTMTAIPACGSAVLPVALGRLPKNKAEGDIPKMGLASAQGDQLECLLRKIGVDDAEFTNAAGTGRIHLYSHNGMTLAGETNGPTNLWGNAATLNTYDFLVAPCDNNHNVYPPPTVAGPNTTNPPNPTATAAQRANVKAYLDAGGRLFTSHWMSHDFVAMNWPPPAGPVQEEYGTNVDADREAPAFPYTIDTTSATGALFAQWAPLVGAGVAGPPPKITFNSWRHLSKTVNTASGATRLSYGDSSLAPVSHPKNASVWAGPHVNMYTFDTPWGGPQCGRVVVSQSHVSAGSGGFPAGCGSAATAMTPQEKAFEFLFFNATACLGAVPTPPPPPPPPVLPTGVVFTADFVGACKVGEQPIWQLFQWQSSTPPGTSIEFRAATAANAGLLPAAPPPALPATVPIGTANNANAVSDAYGWTHDTSGAPSFTPRPVSYHLQYDPTPAQKSQAVLRVYMTFNTSGAVSPILYSWRQLYDCVPAE